MFFVIPITYIYICISAKMRNYIPKPCDKRLEIEVSQSYKKYLKDTNVSQSDESVTKL